ncbi:MAG: hypothetical protein JNM17_35350 [Archangium sp.]|nr:hypothetical protein [Archangium sp.]
MSKYLLLYRNPPERQVPSPAEMEATIAQWMEWKKAHPSIIDMGDGLLQTGRVLKKGVVSDGPAVESKELVSGYSIVECANYDAAVVVAKACPFNAVPGASVEVRELAGY